jgi:hypothetical protein
MADNKDTNIKPENNEKASPEEIKKKKEEVLARIDAEIGEGESSDEVVIDEKTDERVEKGEESEGEESFEKEMIEEDMEVKGEKREEKTGERVQKDEASDEGLTEKEKKNSDKEKNEEDSHSAFSAAEFGLAERKSNKGKNIILFLVVFLLVAIVSALFYFFSTGVLKFEQKENEQEVVPTEVPTATPVPVDFDRAKFSIQVLNGSGVSGAAGSIETFLEGLGYENIEIGNADNSDYQSITIQIKKEFEDFVEVISKDLSDSYTVNKDYEILDEDSEYDAVIIVGSESEEVVGTEENLDE